MHLALAFGAIAGISKLLSEAVPDFLWHQWNRVDRVRLAPDDTLEQGVSWLLNAAHGLGAGWLELTYLLAKLSGPGMGALVDEGSAGRWAELQAAMARSKRAHDAFMNGLFGIRDPQVEPIGAPGTAPGTAPVVHAGVGVAEAPASVRPERRRVAAVQPPAIVAAGLGGPGWSPRGVPDAQPPPGAGRSGGRREESAGVVAGDRGNRELIGAPAGWGAAAASGVAPVPAAVAVDQLPAGEGVRLPDVAGLQESFVVDGDRWMFATKDVEVAGRLVKAGTVIDPDGNMWDTTDQDRRLEPLGTDALAQVMALAPSDGPDVGQVAGDQMAPVRAPAPTTLWTPAAPGGEPQPDPGFRLEVVLHDPGGAWTITHEGRVLVHQDTTLDRVFLPAGTVIGPDGQMTRDGQPSGDFVRLREEAAGAAAPARPSPEVVPEVVPEAAGEEPVARVPGTGPSELPTTSQAVDETPTSQQQSTLPASEATVESAVGDGRRSDATSVDTETHGDDEAGSADGELHTDLGPDASDGGTSGDTFSGNHFAAPV